MTRHPTDVVPSSKRFMSPKEGSDEEEQTRPLSRAGVRVSSQRLSRVARATAGRTVLGRCQTTLGVRAAAMTPAGIEMLRHTKGARHDEKGWGSPVTGGRSWR